MAARGALPSSRRWKGMRRNSSITAEPKKQAAPTHTMGASPTQP